MLRSPYDISRRSVICLSVVCDLVARYTEGWTFQQYFPPFNSPGTQTVCIKILEKNQRDSK